MIRRKLSLVFYGFVLSLGASFFIGCTGDSDLPTKAPEGYVDPAANMDAMKTMMDPEKGKSKTDQPKQ